MQLAFIVFEFEYTLNYLKHITAQLADSGILSLTSHEYDKVLSANRVSIKKIDFC